MIRVAAAGDVHASELTRERTEQAFAAVQQEADVILLAGDLTTHGEPDEARVLADACRALDVPIYTVLGNHDYHAEKVPEITAILEGAGLVVLERSWTISELNGTQLGIVGTKGF